MQTKRLCVLIHYIINGKVGTVKLVKGLVATINSLFICYKWCPTINGVITILLHLATNVKYYVELTLR